MAAAMGVLAIGVSWHWGCSSDNTAPTRPPDTTPPATVPLYVEEALPDTVGLQWQAPGDNGMGGGSAAAYDLRYATFPFGEENWQEATQFPLPKPEDPHSLEQARIGGLEPGVTHYYAIRTRDGVGNWSEMSPLVNLTQPLEEGYPVLLSGELLPLEGTTASSFIYRVLWKTEHGTIPADPPRVAIGENSYAMRFVEQAPTGDILYEFSATMAEGSYDFRFNATDSQGDTSSLPNPGTWSGPSVEETKAFSLDVVEVPAGSFLMGNADPDSKMEERPPHEVVLTHDFWMDRYQITNTQLANAYNWALARGMVEIIGDTLVQETTFDTKLLDTAPREGGTTHGIQYAEETGFTPIPYREDWPATYVTWYGAAFFCNVRSWRERPGIDGNFELVVGGPSPVGSYPSGANRLGLRDLIGNVWEWTNDWNGFYSEGLQVDPPGPRTGSAHSVRGGSWSSVEEELRCARRFSLKPSRAYDGLGFRCVRSKHGDDS
jgi:formylglycine-generating enzyme required for sulfatase activity